MLMQVIFTDAYKSRKEMSITTPTTKKQEKKVIDDLFACYEEKVMTTRKEALEDE